MRKLFFKSIIMVSFIFTLACATINAVMASNNSPDFSVNTVPSKYQSENHGYFDLDLLKAGKKTTLKLKVFNSSNQMAAFDVSVNDALTNENLILDYSGEKHYNQSLSGLKLSDYVMVNTPTITLQPQSRASIILTVKMPLKKFDGQIVGGVYLQKHVTKNKKGTTNAFGYVNTIILRSGNQTLKGEPKITKARYISRNKAPAVEGVIKNNIQAYNTTMYLKQYITDSRGKVIETNSIGGRSAVPKSQTNVYFKLKEPLSSGKYYYNFEFKDKNNQLIKSSAPFNVSKADAMMVNANKLTLTMLLFIILMLIIFFLLIFLLFSRRHRKDDGKKRK